MWVEKEESKFFKNQNSEISSIKTRNNCLKQMPIVSLPAYTAKKNQQKSEKAFLSQISLHYAGTVLIIQRYAFSAYE